ncbi:MAG: hypothetical protein ACF8MJ_01315 [Phycisphaerales bacterium JB050]
MNGLIHVAQVINECQRVSGRKKLQKIVHILQCCGVDFPHEFGYLHYGPYSPQLRSDLESLEKMNLIKEEESSTQTGYPQYDCEALPALGETLGSLAVESPSWSSHAKKLNQMATPLLEAMSTILFLQNRGFNGSRLKERFESLKPSLVNRFEDATKEIRDLQTEDLLSFN